MSGELEKPTVRAAQRGKGVSTSLVIGTVVLGVLLGFMAGLIYSTSVGSTQGESSVLYDEELVASLVDRVSPAVVEITVIRRPGGLDLPGTGVGTGSGFLVDSEGHIVTNHHVVDGAQ